jgi:prepilin-type N-terminal cleavage/methylation domain-containing protein
MLSFLHAASRRPARRGFTLIELMIVIGIITLLAGTIIGWLIYGKTKAENERCRAAMTILSTGLERYKEVHGHYPRIEEGPEDATRINQLLAELFLRKQYKTQSGLVRFTEPALEDIKDVQKFIGDSDGDWDESQGFFDAEGNLIQGLEILDPWGQPFVYRQPGDKHEEFPGAVDNSRAYDLYSIGRNGVDESDATDPDQTDDWTNWYQRDTGER